MNQLKKCSSSTLFRTTITPKQAAHAGETKKEKPFSTSGRTICPLTSGRTICPLDCRAPVQTQSHCAHQHYCTGPNPCPATALPTLCKHPPTLLHTAHHIHYILRPKHAPPPACTLLCVHAVILLMRICTWQHAALPVTSILLACSVITLSYVFTHQKNRTTPQTPPSHGATPCRHLLLICHTPQSTLGIFSHVPVIHALWVARPSPMCLAAS